MALTASSFTAGDGTPCDGTGPDQGADKALDGDVTTTASCQFGELVTLQVSFDAAALESYEILTSGSTADADPISWQIECRPVGSTDWIVLKNMENVPPPDGRRTSYGIDSFAKE